MQKRHEITPLLPKLNCCAILQHHSFRQCINFNTRNLPFEICCNFDSNYIAELSFQCRAFITTPKKKLLSTPKKFFFVYFAVKDLNYINYKFVIVFGNYLQFKEQKCCLKTWLRPRSICCIH